MSKIKKIEDIDETTEEGKMLLSAISILSTINIDIISSGKKTILEYLYDNKDYTSTSTKGIISKISDISNSLYTYDNEYIEILDIHFDRKRKLSKI